MLIEVEAPARDLVDLLRVSDALVGEGRTLVQLKLSGLPQALDLVGGDDATTLAHVRAAMRQGGS